MLLNILPTDYNVLQRQQTIPPRLLLLRTIYLQNLFFATFLAPQEDYPNS